MAEGSKRNWHNHKSVIRLNQWKNYPPDKANYVAFMDFHCGEWWMQSSNQQRQAAATALLLFENAWQLVERKLERARTPIAQRTSNEGKQFFHSICFTSRMKCDVPHSHRSATRRVANAQWSATSALTVTTRHTQSYSLSSQFISLLLSWKNMSLFCTRFINFPSGNCDAWFCAGFSLERIQIKVFFCLPWTSNWIAVQTQTAGWRAIKRRAGTIHFHFAENSKQSCPNVPKLLAFCLPCYACILAIILAFGLHQRQTLDTQRTALGLGIFYRSKRMNFMPIQFIWCTEISDQLFVHKSCMRTQLTMTNVHRAYAFEPIGQMTGGTHHLFEVISASSCFSYVIYGSQWLRWRCRIRSKWLTHFFIPFRLVFTAVSRAGAFCHQSCRAPTRTPSIRTYYVIIKKSLRVMTFRMKCINSFASFGIGIFSGISRIRWQFFSSAASLSLAFHSHTNIEQLRAFHMSNAQRS